MNSPGQFVLVLLAAFGLLCAAVVLTGQVPPAVVGIATSGTGDDCPRDCAEPAPSQAADAGLETAPVADDTAKAQTPLSLRRTQVCERGEALPTLQAMPEGRWLVHCGPEAHLIAFEATARGPSPRRIARFAIAAGTERGMARPGPALGLDPAGGTRRDLWVGTQRIDALSNPVGGGLHRAPHAASGSWLEPTRVLSLTPGALLDAELDGAPPRELVVLHLGDPRTARAAELWTVDAGPAPLRTQRRQAAASARAIAAADLDGDGKDELAAAAPGEGRVELWPSSGAAGDTLPAPTSLELTAARELLSVDRNGDGRPELFALGAQLVRVELVDGAPRATPLSEGEGVHGLHAHDTDADGRPELVGYAHPALRVVGEEARELLRLQGEGLSIADVRLAHLDADGRGDLLVLAVGDAADGAVELAVATATPGARAARLSRSTEPLRDAPLSLRFDLR
ncbi:MAG: VCBS repeat-containing protein [Myxococcales bacterium]|nr:VCBS repeat-containing protein [Myxococcales bacterium]